jgi:hypothetical protein
MKDRQRGQLLIMGHATTEQWRGKIYLLTQYGCNLSITHKTKD